MATGTSPRASASAFHDDDPEQTTEYRSLSVLALVSLVLGLLSPLCFGAVLLMAIPLVGIAVSVLALRQIAASGGTLAGKWAAVTGLVLCVVFAVAPVTRVYVLRSIRTHQADEFAHNWINMMLAGKTDRAFRLTMDSTRPPRPPEPGQPPPKGTPYDAFMELPIVKAIVAAGPEATIRPIGAETYDAQSFYRVFVRQRYEITPKTGADDVKPVELMITVQRAKLPTEGRMRWLVTSLEDANKPAPTMPQ
jgi:hypothetical protein